MLLYFRTESIIYYTFLKWPSQSHHLLKLLPRNLIDMVCFMEIHPTCGTRWRLKSEKFRSVRNLKLSTPVCHMSDYLENRYICIFFREGVFFLPTLTFRQLRLEICKYNSISMWFISSVGVSGLVCTSIICVLYELSRCDMFWTIIVIISWNSLSKGQDSILLLKIHWYRWSFAKKEKKKDTGTKTWRPTTQLPKVATTCNLSRMTLPSKSSIMFP